MSQLKDEINEKIPKKTQKIIIYAISLIIAVVFGVFVFRPLYTNAMTNKTESEKLEKTLTEYKKMDAAKETNKKSIEQYESNTKTMLAKYPRDIYPEDMIMVLSGLEQQTGILFTDVSVENNNYVTLLQVLRVNHLARTLASQVRLVLQQVQALRVVVLIQVLRIVLIQVILVLTQVRILLIQAIVQVTLVRILLIALILVRIRHPLQEMEMQLCHLRNTISMRHLCLAHLK